MEAFVVAARGRMKLHYTLSAPSYDVNATSALEGSFSKGRISKDMMREHLPTPDADSFILICGPDELITSTLLLSESNT